MPFRWKLGLAYLEQGKKGTLMPRRGSATGIDSSAILGAAAESILVTSTNLDPPGPEVIYANPAFEKMTGWRIGQILGQSPRLLQGPKTDLNVFANMRKVLRRGGVWEGLAINYRRDGTEFWMEWSIAGLRDEQGEIYQYMAIQRDVTARIEMQHSLRRAQLAASAAERARVNLARYFPPKLVATLAAKDQPLGPVKQQDLAVLFADIVGFTKLSEGLEPADVMQLLRDIHAWMQKVIFKWNGTIEGYIGDEVLAIFGFPENGGSGASNALACAYELLSSAQDWNQERARMGQPPVRIGIGLHYGPVVLGDVGTADFVEFTVIGDTVNTASRLQEATRRLVCDLVVGQPLLDAVRAEQYDPTQAGRFANLKRFGPLDIRGRQERVEVWTLSKGED